MKNSTAGSISFLIRICILAAALLVPRCPAALALEVPALQHRVNDYAGLISAATKTQLEQSLQYLEQTDSTQIAVLIIPSLEGDNLEQFSLRVAEKWRIGQAGRDNGALLLVAVNDRKLRIEVGYGLEGLLTDLTSGRIIRNIILPRFKEGNFDQGIIDGVAAMNQAVKGEFSADLTDSQGKTDSNSASIVTMLVFFFFFVGNILRGSKVASAVVGGIGAPIIGTLIFGYSLPLIFGLIPVGIVGGLIVAKLFLLGGSSSGPGTWISTGGFGGGSSGGFGGFSGGGGGFGGGGASGGW